MVITRSQQQIQPANSDHHVALPIDLPETLNERRSRWSRLLHKQHFQPVIEEVLSEELPKYAKSTAIGTADSISLVQECALILSSAPSVFAAAVDGNLAHRIKNDADLQENYDMIQKRAHSQPSIYIHLLADDNGVSLTPNQYLVVRELILDYIAENHVSKHAYYIDNFTPPQVTEEVSALGHRKYIYTKVRSSSRVEALKLLCNGIEKRWLETPPAQRDTPFRFPPGECGYSVNAHTRLAQHRKHQSSNYIMNLVEDICTYLHKFGRFTQHFRLHQFIIYLIFRPTQAAIAEIFCSGLMQVWIENGGGMNAYPAGRSVMSATKVSDGKWHEHEGWVREQSPVNKNMRMQSDRAEEWRKALDWKEKSDDEEMVDSGR